MKSITDCFLIPNPKVKSLIHSKVNFLKGIVPYLYLESIEFS